MYAKRFMQVIIITSLFLMAVSFGLAFSAGSPQVAQAGPAPTNQASIEVISSAPAGFTEVDTRLVEDRASAGDMNAPRRVAQSASSGSNIHYVALSCSGVPTPCYTTVQGAIDAAIAPTAVIKVAAGVYYTQPHAGSIQVAHITKSLALQGGYTTTDWTTSDPVARPTILDAQGNGRVIYIAASVTATIEGFHIRNGVFTSTVANTGGGGIYIDSGGSVIRSNWIYSNTVTVNAAVAQNGGGGLYIASGSPLIQHNDIYNNTALAAGLGKTRSGGGGLHVRAGGATIEDNNIHGNFASIDDYGGGGGIYIYGADPLTVTVRDNTIANNSIITTTRGWNGGGGIYIHADDTIVEDNQIYSNTVQAPATGNNGGGGIRVFGIAGTGQPRIRRNSIYSNTVNVSGTNDSGGGGVYLAESQAIVERNEIHHNTTNGIGTQQGGGIYIRSQSNTIQNNLIHANAADRGGGIYIRGGVSVILNNTIYGNQAATNGGGIFNAGAPDIRNNIVANNVNDGVYGGVTVYYSDVWGNVPGSDYAGGASAGTGSISEDPGFINPGADFRLRSSSPCINVADPTIYPEIDYAGYARPFGTRADMGAYEFYGGSCFAQVDPDPQVYTTTQAAVDAANPGDLVKVAGRCFDTNDRGGQFQALYLTKTLTIQGGYTTTNWIAPDHVANPTTLDAQGGGRGVYISGTISPRLEGLRITGGDATTGGGLYNNGSNTTLVNVTIVGNTATDGGGLYNTNSNLTLVNLAFEGNSANLGGGMYISNSNPTLVNVTFSGNSASSNGGGMYNNGNNPKIVNVTFVSNTATTNGGGIYNSSSNPTVTNSILWDNTPNQITGTGTSPSVTYSLVQGGCPTGATCSGPLPTTNPQFIRNPDPGAGDYGDLRLQSNSPAKDVGNNTVIPSDTVDLDNDGITLTEQIPLDLAGNSRFDSASFIVDMGAYEATYANLRLVKTAQPGAFVSPGDPITYTLTFYNDGPSRASNVRIEDEVPVPLTDASYARIAGPDISPVPGYTYTWQVDDMDPNSSGVIRITGIVSPSLAQSLSFSNTASITTTAIDTATLNNAGNVGLTALVLNDRPSLAINQGLTLMGGTSATIGTAQLQVTDDENGPALLTYTLQAGPTHGNLLLDSMPLAASASFTQAVIDLNRLAYAHDGSITYSDAFTFTATDSPDPTTRVSVRSDGVEGNNNSSAAALSADGRYVAFASDATNLIGAGNDTNANIDIFVHDRETGQTTRVSVGPGGAQATGGDSYTPSVSADGRYVAFASDATNLIGAGNDTNNATDIFVHDRVAGQTTRVSVHSDGTEGDNNSYASSISADGRYVAFASAATNLVSGDTNGQVDIFVHYRETGQTTRVSVGPGGVQASDGDSYAPSVSADGRYIAFASAATNLVSGDGNNATDIFVRDRVTGQTTRVSVGPGGAQASGGNSYAPALSADGRYVAFASAATNLVSDTNTVTDTFVHDRAAEQTTRISIDSTGNQATGGGSYDPAISVDGRYVAFASDATNLVSGDTLGFTDIFVRDQGALWGAFAINIVFPDLSVTKSAVPTQAVPGELVVYTLGFSNTRDATAANVVITDIVPSSLTVQSVVSSGLKITPTGSVSYTWLVGTMPPGVSGTITITGQITVPLPVGFVFSNTATITTTTIDSNTANNRHTVSVTILNAPPLAADDSITTPEDISVTVRPLTNDQDLNGDVLSITAVGIPLTGTATPSGTTQVVYTPGQDFTGTDAFTYTVGDGHGGFDTAIVTVIVNPANDPPVANDDIWTTDEDSILSVQASGVLSNDIDIDGDTLTVTDYDITSTHGASLTVNPDGSYTYDPSGSATLQALVPGQVLTDTFTYTIADSQGITDTATVSITVNGLNDAPLAYDDTGATDEDSVLSVVSTTGVLSNDIDLDNGDVLTVTTYDITSTSGASVTVNPNGSYVYDPTDSATLQALAIGEILTDTFTYTVIDRYGLTGTATVSITVSGLNDAPLANDDTNATDEDTALNVAAPGVLFNDDDPDTTDSLTVTDFNLTSAYGADVVVNPGGSYTYDPTGSAILQVLAPGQVLTDTFAYTIADSQGITDTATVSITVNGLNDAPTAVDDEATTPEGTSVAINVLANDSDIENDPLSIGSVGSPLNGTATISGTQVVYTPGIDFHGTDTFTYTATDGSDESSPATVTITVTPLANLSIVKTATPIEAAAGKPIRYTLTFSNAGHVTATDVLITDVIPLSVTNVSFTYSGAAVTAISPTSYTWQVEDLGPSKGGLITITGIVSPNLPPGGAFTNTATITTASVDRDPRNNTSSVMVTMPNADLVITKTASPEPVIAGTTLTYTITIFNQGPDPASNVILSDTLPPSTTLGLVDQTDDDNDHLGFGGGTHQNTRWADPRPAIYGDEQLELANTNTGSGTFTSRVMDALSVAAWDSLVWVPRRPYWKELPGGRQAETGYTFGNADMIGNRILLHLNEVPGATIFNDTSGLGNQGICPAAGNESCPTAGVDGRFNQALRFDGTLSNTVVISDAVSPMRYAIELWVRPAIVTDTSFILRTHTVSGTTTRFSHLLGISNGKFVHYVNDGRGRVAVGTTHVAAGTWYHLVGTAASGGDIKLYVNGMEEARVSGTRTLQVSGDQYRLGSTYGPIGTTSYFSGDLDEVAIYTRTLSAGEVNDHYLRGALRLSFQVRSCDDPLCAGETFVGPGRLTSTVYSEQSNSSLGLPSVTLTGVPDNRYFQYRATLVTEDPDYSPELRRVTVGPDHATITASRGNCEAPSRSSFSCTTDPLAVGEFITITAQVIVDPSALGTITNSAIVTATTPDLTLPNTASVTSTVTALSDLRIEKYSWEDPVNVGSVFTYYLDVHNHGPSTAYSVTVTDTLPSGMIGLASGRGWTCQPGNTITCTIPRLNVGWSAIRITVTAPLTEGVIVNTAWITSTLTPDPDITNNSDWVTTTVTTLADLVIAKSAAPSPVWPGDPLTYTITITNLGPSTAENVVVTDTLLSGLTGSAFGEDWSCNPATGQTIICRLSYPLAPTQSASFNITVTAPLTGLLTNRAEVGSDTLDPNDTNNVAFAYTVVVRVTDLSVSKSDTPDPVYAGAPLTYTVTITNAGPATAGALTATMTFVNDHPFRITTRREKATPYFSNINISGVTGGTIRDASVMINGLSHTYPADLSILLVGPDRQTGVVLMSNAGGGTEVRNVRLTFNDAGIPLPVSGTFSSTVVYRPTNYGLYGDFPPPAPTGPYAGSLSALVGTDPNGLWRLYVYDNVTSDGGQITFGWSMRLTIGTTDTITLTDILPAGLGGVSVTPASGWTCDVANNMTCSTPYLGVTSPAMFTISATAPITGGVITNTATITTTTPDPDASSNTVSITTTVLSSTDLAIIKQANSSLVNPGAPLTYTLIISNAGPGSVMTRVTVTDSLPGELTNVSVLGGSWACDTSGLPVLTCTIEGLPVGYGPNIVITATAPLSGGIVLTNTADITAVVTDPDPLNNSAFVTTAVAANLPPIANAGPDQNVSAGTLVTLDGSASYDPDDDLPLAYRWTQIGGPAVILNSSTISQPTFTAPSATTVLTFSLIVTDARGLPDPTPDEVVITVGQAPGNRLYLPIVMRTTAAPDLVVEKLVVTSDAMTVTIKNQGTLAIAQDFSNEFWVDLYINPITAPTGVNQTWAHLGTQGIAWGIKMDAFPLDPGDMLTLTARAGTMITETIGGAYLSAKHSFVTWTLPVSTPVWVQVDSVYTPTVYGVIQETHEILGREYNNIAGPVYSTYARSKITEHPITGNQWPEGCPLLRVKQVEDRLFRVTPELKLSRDWKNHSF